MLSSFNKPYILKQIVTHKRVEIAEQKKRLPLDKLKASVTSGNDSFLQAMKKEGLKIIAEIKPKSPSAGILCTELAVEEIIEIYNKYACAISVLTDEQFFAGSFSLLKNVVQQSNLPTLCKDFILDPYQCFLARKSGAQAVLLIVKILTDKDLRQLYEQINALGMTAVLEIQNENELKRVISLKPQPEIVLINNRNLEDFTINLDTTKKLAPLIPDGTIIISASGIESKQDLLKLLPFCSNFLIGSLFMRSPDLLSTFQDLIDISGYRALIDITPDMDTIPDMDTTPEMDIIPDSDMMLDIDPQLINRPAAHHPLFSSWDIQSRRT